MQLRRNRCFESCLCFFNNFHSKSCHGKRFCFSNLNNWNEHNQTRGTTTEGTFWIFYAAIFDSIWEQFSWEVLSKIKHRLQKNCWEVQCQLRYNCWTNSRVRPSANFQISSVWRKCWRTYFVVGQISQPEWGIAGVTVWCSLEDWLENPVFWYVSLFDKIAMIVLIPPLSFPRIDFKDWRDRLILPPATPDLKRQPRILSGVLFCGRLVFFLAGCLCIWHYLIIKPQNQVILNTQCPLLISCPIPKKFILLLKRRLIFSWCKYLR